MNLLVVNASADLYGANRILANTLEFLQHEHEITLLLPDSGPLVHYLEERKLNVRIIFNNELPNIARFLFNFKGLCSLLAKLHKTYGYLKKLKKRHNLECVYVNTQSCLLLLKLCKLNGIPAILHVHEIVDTPRLAATFINRKSLKWANKIIAVSDPVKNNLLESGNTQRYSKKVNVVLNGITDPSEKLGREVNSIRLDDDRIVISLIARIKPEKGIWFFLDAVAALPECIANKCVFNIVGGAPPNGEHFVHKLNQDINSHKYNKLISYSSFMLDVTSLQYNSDILVIPSLMKDPFPTTILEGMALGKPVIATNTGGAVQSVEHGKTGYLIAPEDVPAFVNYLTLLIEDKELRKAIGTEARQQYLTRFTINVFKSNFLKTFNSLVI